MAVLIHFLIDNLLGIFACLELGNLGGAVLDLSVVVNLFDLELDLESREGQLTGLSERCGFFLANDL